MMLSFWMTWDPKVACGVGNNNFHMKIYKGDLIYGRNDDKRRVQRASQTVL